MDGDLSRERRTAPSLRRAKLFLPRPALALPLQFELFGESVQLLDLRVLQERHQIVDLLLTGCLVVRQRKRRVDELRQERLRGRTPALRIEVVAVGALELRLQFLD